MPPEQVGEMGYAISVDDDRRLLDKLELAVPKRFEARGAREADFIWLDAAKKIGKHDHGYDDGFSFQWLEESAGILLDKLYKQLIGSCVATSHITLLATAMLRDILLFGDGEKLLGHELSGVDAICPYGPFSYRTGRKKAGINGNGDGSTCSGQLAGTMQYGFLPCTTPNLQSDYFPEPKSNSLYRRWGANDSLMNQFTGPASKFDLVESVRVRDGDTAKNYLLNEFKPLQICSNWGFAATGKTLSNGLKVYTKRGSWSHSMQVVGFVSIDGGWYVIIRNQWGNTHGGKNYFLVEMSEFNRWIANSNTMTIGDIVQRESDDADMIPDFGFSFF